MKAVHLGLARIPPGIRNFPFAMTRVLGLADRPPPLL